MKLRNKKTGEIREAISHAPIDVYFFDKAGKNGITRRSYGSLAELNEEWEDYVPTEPLIKDEKIRKAVRAWWEAVSSAMADKRILYKKSQDFAVGIYTICCGVIYSEVLEDGKMYTIEELCGEDED